MIVSNNILCVCKTFRKLKCVVRKNKRKEERKGKNEQRKIRWNKNKKERQKI